MLFYVISYDISCDKRRKKVADLLEGYGQRVQFSVFECVLKDERYAELRFRLKDRVDMKEDSIRFYPISSHTLGKIEIWGGVPIMKNNVSTVI